jgi:glyoxylase-like metal-dependent hydrolase (beta-lactamase superfamily II)
MYQSLYYVRLPPLGAWRDAGSLSEVYMPDMAHVGGLGTSRSPAASIRKNGFQPGLMLFGLTEDCVKRVRWLHLNNADAEGALRVSFHAYAIEPLARRIIVDTCVGNDKPQVGPDCHRLSTPFQERLDAAGFTPELIDFVACTHMRIDRVGWNTRWDGARWTPTFPNVRYLFGRPEWGHGKRDDAGIGDVPPPIAELIETQTVVADSVVPVIDAGLADFVETDHRITNEVSLFPAPGHTPGHVSVAISSGGEEAVIVRDVIHHPVQLADPGIGATFDTDRKLAQATQRAFIDDHADRNVLLLGTHFTAPSAGRIVSDETAWRFAPIRGEPHR